MYGVERPRRWWLGLEGTLASVLVLRGEFPGWGAQAPPRHSLPATALSVADPDPDPTNNWAE